jgi:hypothetical protein
MWYSSHAGGSDLFEQRTKSTAPLDDSKRSFDLPVVLHRYLQKPLFFSVKGIYASPTCCSCKTFPEDSQRIMIRSAAGPNSPRIRSRSSREATTRRYTATTRWAVLVLTFLACLFASSSSSKLLAPPTTVYAFTGAVVTRVSHERYYHHAPACPVKRNDANSARKSSISNMHQSIILYAATSNNNNSNNKIMDDETDRLRARALEVLKKSKAKLAAMEEQRQAAANNAGTSTSSSTATKTATTTSLSGDAAAVVVVPFFASAIQVQAPPRRIGTTSTSLDQKRDAVTKSRNAQTGMITTDGEKMAALSEKEEWESRPLMQVFQNENNAASSSSTSRQLADRDVAASIFNLRQKLHTLDYQRIFDPRNRFIGEDN